MRVLIVIVSLFGVAMSEPVVQNAELSPQRRLGSIPRGAQVDSSFRWNDNRHVVLDNLQNALVGRLHAKYIDDFNETNESAILDHIAQLLSTSRSQLAFDDDRETERMKAIDYLGEKLRGRIACDDKIRVAKLLREHLYADLISGPYEKRQKQSLVGDQIEIMRYWAMADESEARHMLNTFRSQPIYAHLQTGLQNAVWLNGH